MRRLGPATAAEAISYVRGAGLSDSDRARIVDALCLGAERMDRSTQETLTMTARILVAAARGLLADEDRRLLAEAVGEPDDLEDLR